MKTILLVEDHPNLGALYQEELSEAGYHTLHARSGDEAGQHMAGHHLDLVVIEPSAPSMDVMQRMLADWPELPVIINSGDGHPPDTFCGWDSAAFVSKSSDLSELLSQIQQVLDSPKTKRID